jgi:hypothetical protein
LLIWKQEILASSGGGDVDSEFEVDEEEEEQNDDGTPQIWNKR